MQIEDRICQMARGPNIARFKLLEFNSIFRGKKRERNNLNGWVILLAIPPNK